jgi:hypothetical protein
MARTIYGIDVSYSRLTPGWLAARPQVAVVVQNVWTGGRVPQVAAANLQVARDAGRVAACYVVASPWYGPGAALTAIKRQLGGLWDTIRIAAVDVETMRATPQSPAEWPSQERVWEYIDALRSEGKTICLYTARWFWTGYYGNDADPRWASVPLWYMDATREPRQELLPPNFGPWGQEQVVGRQYNLDVTIDGVNLDENAFDPAFWGGEAKMDDRLDVPVTYKVVGPDLSVVARSGTLADFLRDLALGYAWTVKDDAQDIIVQQLMERIAQLESQLDELRRAQGIAPHVHGIEGKTTPPL